MFWGWFKFDTTVNLTNLEGHLPANKPFEQSLDVTEVLMPQQIESSQSTERVPSMRLSEGNSRETAFALH